MSWALQDAHQSAERSTTSTTPLGPRRDSNVRRRSWVSVASKSGMWVPMAGPVRALRPWGPSGCNRGRSSAEDRRVAQVTRQQITEKFMANIIQRSNRPYALGRRSRTARHGVSCLYAPLALLLRFHDALHGSHRPELFARVGQGPATQAGLG